jgi:predicted Zn finger-like uncharacterized protein
LIVTCPGCRTRYRVDAAALARPRGRTVRCAACGLSWRYPPVALDTLPREPAIVEPPWLQPTGAAPTHAEPVAPLPHRRLWLRLGLPLLAVLLLFAVSAAYYLHLYLYLYK